MRRVKSSCERPLLALTALVSSCVEQKDSHTVYLEQELDSLKVVLDMKNQQLHQKDKKLLEMERLVGTRTLYFWSRFWRSLLHVGPLCVSGGGQREAGGVSEEGPAGERGLQGPDGQTRRAVKVRAGSTRSL